MRHVPRLALPAERASNGYSLEKIAAKESASALARQERFTDEGWLSYETLGAMDLIRPERTHGWIYYLEEAETDPSPLKIGWAKDPLRRVTLLQTGNPRLLRVRQCFIGYESVERHTHKRWAHVRRASEWFDGSQREQILALADAIAAAQRDGDIERADSLLSRAWTVVD